MTCKVNLKLIPVKALNFLFYAGFACYFPYKPLFQKQLGLSSTQNGLIQASDKIVGIITQPISGMIADKTGSIKAVMIIWFLLATAFIFPMYFVPASDFTTRSITFTCCPATNNSSQVVCTDGEKSLVTCNIDTDTAQYTRPNVTMSTRCSIIGNTSSSTVLTDSCSSASDFVITTPFNVSCPWSVNEPEEEYGLTFGLMLFLTIISSMFLAPAVPLVDATTMKMLGEGNADNYGLQRLWGAVGFGAVALIVGLVTDAVSSSQTDEEKDYLFTFVTFAVMLLLTAAVCFKLDVASPAASNILVGLTSLMKQLKIIIFFLVVYVIGCSVGFQYTFLFWYVVTLPGSSQTILGVSVLVNCASEIPHFMASGYLAKKSSYNFLLAVGLFVYGVRFLGYSLINEAWQVIIIEVLHGPSFALPMAAINVLATKLAPRSLVATMVGLTHAIFWGFGFTTGALVGGVAYNNLGPITSFRGMMVICFICTVLFGTAYKLEERFAGKKNNDTDDKEETSCAVA